MSLKIGESISIISFNCQGIRNKGKRYNVINYLKNTGAKIICLQDTHLIQTDMAKLKNDWNGNIYLNGSKTNARGVAILISNSLEYKVTHTEMDAVGNMLLLDITVCNIKIRLLNIYGPNTDDPNFFVEMENFLSKHDQSYIIWCGEFNLTLNPKLDSYNYVTINNNRSVRYYKQT